MRKLIIKFFALDYVSNIFGKNVKWVRAANIIFPLMLLSGIVTVSSDLYLYQHPFGIFLLVLLALAIFFGFWYFDIAKPVKWEELSDNQKWQFGSIVSTNYYLDQLTPNQVEEFIALSKKYNEIYTTKTWYNVLPFLVNILCVIAGVIYLTQ